MIIQTHRLAISLLTTQDAPFILELVNTPSWIKFIGDKSVHTLEDAEGYLLDGPIKSYLERGFGLYLVRVKEEDKPIGICGVLKRENLDYPDIGFAFLPECENKGYGFEAASAVVLHAKEELELDRLLAITVLDNARSIKLLEKLGFAYDRSFSLESSSAELLVYGRSI